MKRLLILPLAALAACDAEPAARNDAVQNTASADDVDYLARIRAMPQGQRDAVFLRAIRDAGRSCQEVTELTEVTGADANGRPGPATWAARCEDGGRWIVAISPAGVATVTDQAELQGRG